MKKEKVDIPLTTLDFFRYEEEGFIVYEFDARECTPPEPMVNTINALKLITADNIKVIGTYFHEPFPLYERISTEFSHIAKELPSGDFQVTFQTF